MFFATPIAYGHHSFPVLFDPSQTVTVTGVVTEFEFRAPHCYIRVAAQDANGVQIAWELETTSPGQLIRIGLTPEILKPGAEISAVGNPARDGRPLIRLLTLTMPSGEELRIQ
jgi:hypothetical protein